MTRSDLLKRISAIQFALWETHVFLDTHVGDPVAREMHDSYIKKYNALVEEFEKQYGPLSLSGTNSDEWLKDPWPWDVVDSKEEC